MVAAGWKADEGQTLTDTLSLIRDDESRTSRGSECVAAAGIASAAAYNKLAMNATSGSHSIGEHQGNKPF